MKEVYITRTSHFLPNDPVSNEEIEERLGKINNEPSRARRIVLRNNGIKTRYYALDNNGEVTHNNAELTKLAIDELFHDDFEGEDVELISCGTTAPDTMLPSHSAMVHGLLNIKNVEINTASGGCCSGMNALKYGYLAIKSGDKKNAVCAGSERLSTWMQSIKFDNELKALSDLEDNPMIGFQKDFLRWMLSDGAGAMLLENKPRGEKSLKIEWMDAYSFADEIETCMYAGGEKLEDGSLKSWSEYSPNEWLDKSIFSLKQDVRLLDEYVIQKGVTTMKESLEKNNLSSEQITYFLPHISSFYFESKLNDEMIKQGVQVPKDRWFINLDKVGNVGAASIYLMLDELWKSDKIKKGDSLYFLVPESSRFSYFNVLVTVC